MPSSTTDNARPLVLTLGDPAGIGPEITFKAWEERRAEGLPPFALVAPLSLAEALRDRLSPDTPIEAVESLAEAVTVFERTLPVFAAGLEAARSDVTPGTPDPVYAPLVIGSIEAAVRLARQGQAAGVVTNPISKSHLYAAGFTHPGHTEFLAALCAEGDGPAPSPVMMLAIEGLRVVPLTIHLALRHVAGRITEDLITATARQVLWALERDFGIVRPRLAVAGLNPHAGEGGAMGDEEARIITPAINALKAEGHDVSGPVPADSMFHTRARAKYDAALCMYHDQALVPLKTLDFDRGVNITLGLPIVRTSPDHGTAFDIAGKGVANPASLMAALMMAAEMAARRSEAA